MTPRTVLLRGDLELAQVTSWEALCAVLRLLAAPGEELIARMHGARGTAEIVVSRVNP